MSSLLDAVHGLEGHLDPLETVLLHNLAAQCPESGVIVEIGSYRGKSTCAIGLGAKEAGAWVYAIDPHMEATVGVSHYGMDSHAALLENLTVFGLGSTVRVVALPSYHVIQGWNNPIDMIFIDGSHEYEDVKRDFEQWSPLVKPSGVLAFHDTSGHFPRISQLMDEIMAVGQWERINLQDATSVFRRVTN